ncbi:MAG TPA: gluconate 2-dehydrogenase subunit 3 family protein [Ohtaekwangia sp.]|nr:gluconate 2-dehydrogenase subunit 3 family protein [Ohtaekwangia sp.]
MNRRLALKQLGLVSAAAVLLPTCIGDPKKVTIALNNLQITSDEEILLGDIADVMIPATKTPGARAVGAHLFTLVMVDDCLPKEQQEKYLKGMRSFEKSLKNLTGKSFSDSSAEQRLLQFTLFEQKLESLPVEIKTFYSTTKHYITQGYLASQYFMTEVKPYQLIPGPDFRGCVPVANNKTVI